MPEVRVLGGMRRLLGATQVSARAQVVRALLDEIAAREDQLPAVLFEDPLAPGRTPHRDLRVLVNGRSIDFLDGLETRLREDDTVTLHLAGARGYPGG